MVALGTELTHATLADVPGSRAHIQWIDYVGGRHLSRPIHTQLTAITDDATTSTSDHILKTSDALLFVADTTEPGIAASAALLDRVRATLREHGNEAASIVVQANKRDATDALPLDEVRTRLKLDADAAMIETVATQAIGVRHAFVVAVTKGLARYGVAERTVPLEATPQELLDALTPTPPVKAKKQAAKKTAGKKRAVKKADAGAPPESSTAKGSTAKGGTAKKKAAAKTGAKPASKKQPNTRATKKPLKTPPPLPDESLLAEGAVATLVEPPTVPATMVPPTDIVPAGGLAPGGGDAGGAAPPTRRSTDNADKPAKADEASGTAAAEPVPTVPAAEVEAAPAPPPPGPDSVRFDAPPPTEVAESATGVAATGRRGKGSGRRGRR